MNATTLFLVTFLVWITAKGEFGAYANLVKTRDVDNSNATNASNGTTTPIAPLPTLKPIG